MKKVLLTFLSVVAINAADGELQVTGAPRKGFTQCLNHNTGNFEFRARPVEETIELRRTMPCPPGPTRKHPTTYFDYTTHKWVRVPACK